MKIRGKRRKKLSRCPPDKRGLGFDVVDIINKITPTNTEFHLNCKGADGEVKKCSFLGPNTNLSKRLKDYNPETGAYSEVLTPPVNALDSLALEHDVAYTSKDLSVRHQADQVLLEGARAIANNPNEDPHTRRQARIVDWIISAKVKLGLGASWGAGAPSIDKLMKEAHQSLGVVIGKSGGAAPIELNPTSEIAYARSGFKTPSTGAPSSGAVAGLVSLIPALALAGAIGIPALVKALKKKKKT
jgi:hypothetical protein